MTDFSKLRAFLDGDKTKQEVSESDDEELELKSKADEADETDETDENTEEYEDKCGAKYKDEHFMSDERFADELLSAVERLIDSKLTEFQDSQKQELKAVSDTYNEVSEAIGATFDYNGMSRNELYKFGYETITGKKLADDMDAVTAFKLVNSKAKQPEKFADSQSTDTNKKSVISEMLEKF